ncbi:MAG: hypothetical protein NTW19_08830 [Planctomycetota bacterium]|nr:hypothetical protein [Planctomycetota bacterium]
MAVASAGGDCGTDYVVFLNAAPAECKEGPLAFRGEPRFIHLDDAVIERIQQPSSMK